jgi:hypothetical protein
MVAEATVGDPMALADAMSGLQASLRELWRLRKAREDEWADVLNFLQTALSGVVPEKLSVEQSQAVGRVIDEHLAAGVLTDDQPSEARRILRGAGLDPWRAISARPIFTNE